MKSYTIYIITLIALQLLSACHKETEEDKIKKIIAAEQKAVESKDLKAMIAPLAKEYRDPQGNDYGAIKDLLLYYVFKHEAITVIVTSLEVTVTDASAVASFQAVLSGRGKLESPASLLPEALGVYRFEVGFKKFDGESKVISAKWERFEERMQ